jgi:hypothetical protein
VKQSAENDAYFTYFLITYIFKKFITSLTIVSFSSGLDSAIIKVMATSALSEIICFPSIMRCLFLFKNSRKIEAPIRLHPSTKG